MKQARRRIQTTERPPAPGSQRDKQSARPTDCRPIHKTPADNKTPGCTFLHKRRDRDTARRSGHKPGHAPSKSDARIHGHDTRTDAGRSPGSAIGDDARMVRAFHSKLPAAVQPMMDVHVASGDMHVSRFSTGAHANLVAFRRTAHRAAFRRRAAGRVGHAGDALGCAPPAWPRPSSCMTSPRRLPPAERRVPPVAAGRRLLHRALSRAPPPVVVERRLPVVVAPPDLPEVVMPRRPCGLRAARGRGPMCCSARRRTMRCPPPSCRLRLAAGLPQAGAASRAGADGFGLLSAFTVHTPTAASPRCQLSIVNAQS